MKKKQDLDRSQYQPFDDFKGSQGIHYGGENPIPSLREKAAFVKSLSAKDSGRLSFLMEHFREMAKSVPAIVAVQSLFLEAAKLRDAKYLSENQWAVLEKAFRGDLKAAQILVRACPDTIRLPFVADAMIEIVREYKEALPGQYTDKSKWQDFLPKRHGGRSPFLPKHLSSLVKAAQKEIQPSDRRKKKASREDADEAVAEQLGLKPTYLTKSVKVKTGRGRPRK